MDIQDIVFSPIRSDERIEKALKVLGPRLLYRFLALTLYLLGAQVNVIAGRTKMPQETVKTLVRQVMKDGFPALRDRRRKSSEDKWFKPAEPSETDIPHGDMRVTARTEGEYCVIDMGGHGNALKIPSKNNVQLRTVVLSFHQAKLLSTKNAASVLNVTVSHLLQLSKKLHSDDVYEALVPKQHLNRSDRLVGSKEKTALIAEFVARTLTGHQVDSQALAQVLSEKQQLTIASRTIRKHMNKLGLRDIGETLPELLEQYKKKS